MTSSRDAGSPPPSVRCATVLRVAEDSAEVLAGGAVAVVGFAASFPSPRTERVSPGHLVALRPSPAGGEVIVWRWYDAVVLGEDAGLVRLWEPAHGEVLAAQRTEQLRPVGSRAYLSAGLAGADWWVAGPVVLDAAAAEVERDEVVRFGAEHGLW